MALLAHKVPILVYWTTGMGALNSAPEHKGPNLFCVKMILVRTDANSFSSFWAGGIYTSPRTTRLDYSTAAQGFDITRQMLEAGAEGNRLPGRTPVI